MQTTRTLFIVSEAAGPTFVGVFDSRAQAELTADETRARVIEVQVPARQGWQLYTIGGWEMAADALTLAAAIAAGDSTDVKNAMLAWHDVARTLIHYGTTDTEPRATAREFFEEFFAAQKVAGR